MVYCFCEDKYTENNIVMYKLQDYKGNTKLLLPMELDKLLNDGEIFVLNLKSIFYLDI